MKIEKIYIIEGYTGEYSDRTQWLVSAYTSKEDALAQMGYLVAKLKELALDVGHVDGLDLSSRRERAKAMEVLDPNFQCDYNGVYYNIITTELVD